MTLRPPLHAWPCRLAVIVAPTLAACGTGESGVGGDPPSGLPGAARSCSVTEVGRGPLTTADGAQLYVEPQASGFLGGSYLLAGQPTYAWLVNPGDRASVATLDPFFGIVMDDGVARPIPLPDGVTTVGWVRGGALEGGRWAFVFEELDGTRGGEREVVRLVYGERDETGWHRVETLPLPPGGDVRVSSLSSLLSGPSGVRFVGRLAGDTGGADVIRYRQTPEGWTVDVVVPNWVDAVDLAGALVPADAGRPGVVGTPRDWLAVAGLDPDFGAQIASVRIVGLDGAPAAPMKVDVAPVGVRYFEPTLVRGDGDLHVGWLRSEPGAGTSAWTAVVDGGVAVARAGASMAEPGSVGSSKAPLALPPALLDESAMSIHAIGMEGGGMLWATLRMDGLTGRQRLRIVRVSPSGVERIADLPTPFLGYIAIVRSSSGELIVVGPEAHLDSTTPFVRSLVIRLSLTCDQVAAADHLPGQ